MRAWLLGMLIAASAGEAVGQDAPLDPPLPGEGRPGAPPPGGPRARLFISPMGEPFRGGPDAGSPQDAWFDGADIDRDGALSEDEMIADASRFFAVLDRRKDGEIDPEDIDRYETVLVPEIRVGGMGSGPGAGASEGGRRGRGGRGPDGGGAAGGRPGAGRSDGNGEGRQSLDVRAKQGAARFGYLDYPEPVTVADRNLNRGIDTVEFRKAAEARFAMLDANGDGKVQNGELPKLSRGFGGRGPRHGGKGERRDIEAAD